MRREATAEEIARWDDLITANPSGGNGLQGSAFAQVKATHGWKLSHQIYELEGATIAVQYLIKKITGLGDFWYGPMGPGVSDQKQLAAIVKANADLPAFLVKLEPEFTSPKPIKIKGLVKAPRDIQYNNHTVVIDLKPSEEDIINSFKQKTRYNIRLGAKKGVVVEAVEATDENCREMYRLMAETQKRAHFFLRSYEYFHDFWTIHSKLNQGQMFFAKFEGKILAGDFVTYLGTKALYKDGGSIREHTDLQPPYVLQWEVIRWLKAHGVEAYDLHGTPPADQIDNPNHPLAGLARFKTGFQPVVTDFVGTYDQPLNARKYAIWNKLGERLAAKYSIKIKKQLFY